MERAGTLSPTRPPPTRRLVIDPRPQWRGAALTDLRGRRYFLAVRATMGDASDARRVARGLPYALALTLASGVAYGLCFPTASLQLLAWVALAPFLLALLGAATLGGGWCRRPAGRLAELQARAYRRRESPNGQGADIILHLASNRNKRQSTFIGHIKARFFFEHH